MCSSKIFFRFSIVVLVFGIQSCRERNFDQSKITMRPKIYMEGSSPIPLFDEYDLKGIQIGTVQNIFSDDQKDRVFAIWLSLDRRSSFYVQKETSSNLGRRFQLVANGQVLGIHPIERTITSGVLPFILSTKMNEQEARFLYEQLGQSIVYLQAELQKEKR